jgi:proton-translocating NADH-quinone oxidoreductase chain N
MNLPGFTWLMIVPLVAAPLVYLSGHLGKQRVAMWVGLAALLGTWVPYGLAFNALSRGGAQAAAVGMVSLRLDGLSLLLAGVAMALGTLVALYSIPYLKGDAGQEKFAAMLVALVGVINGLSCAADLFNLWLWFEGMAITSYLLVAFYHEAPASLEAGIKYLVQSGVGSVLVLLGIGLVLMQTGTLDLAAIHASIMATPATLAAGALFVVGFGVKTALVPLHAWLPDAHSQAPSGISAMLSGIVIEAGLIAMLRVLGGLSGVWAWGALLMGFGALNMLIGNLLALRQTQVKRLLAYSSLSQVGYMLAGVGIAAYAGQAAGGQGGLFHLINHGLMKGLAFLAAGALLYALHLASGDHSPLTVKDLSGAARRYPVTALALSVAVLGLGGLPPLAGFMSKWQIFVAGFTTGSGWIEALIVFAALNSVLSLSYYAPLVNAVYRREPSQAVTAGAALPLSMTAPLVAMTLAVVAIGVWPALMTWLTGPASAALLAAFGR